MTIETRVDGKRSAVFFKAAVRTEKTEFEAKVRNVSTGGALVEVELGQELAKDETGIFIRNGIEVGFNVAWSRPGQFGIRFMMDIDHTAMMRKITPMKTNIIRESNGRLALHSKPMARQT